MPFGLTEWEAEEINKDHRPMRTFDDGIREAAKWLRERADATTNVVKRTAFVEAHNAVLAMLTNEARPRKRKFRRRLALPDDYGGVE